MDEQQPRNDGPPDAEELLRNALIDPEAAISMALKVDGLALSEQLTVVFHGRRDLGTLQTYVANGRHGEGSQLGARDLLRVPCDLDLHEARSRDEAEEAYTTQARALRDALVAADTVLAVWREPLEDLAEARVEVRRSVELEVSVPAPRLMPVALAAPDKQLIVLPVCGARTLAEGRPPLGIACAQQDLARIYPLPDDPEACIEDFLETAARHALETAQRLDAQERSVSLFMELNDEFPEAG
jgi:hypothetical protein